MADLTMARRRAEELLSLNGPSKPPVDAERIARLSKVSVLYASFNDEVKDKVSAYCEENRVIFVNRDQSAERKNYAIAHELAHFVLNPDYVASPRYQVLLLDAPATALTDEEQEARAFASALLLPERMIRGFRDYGDAEKLAGLFVAPADLIRSRLGTPTA